MVIVTGFTAALDRRNSHAFRGATVHSCGLPEGLGTPEFWAGVGRSVLTDYYHGLLVETRRIVRAYKELRFLTAGNSRASLPNHALVSRGQEPAFLIPVEVILYPLAACRAQPYAKCLIRSQPG